MSKPKRFGQNTTINLGAAEIIHKIAGHWSNRRIELWHTDLNMSMVFIWQPGKGDTCGTFWVKTHTHTHVHTHHKQTTSLCSTLTYCCQRVQSDSTALTSISTWLQNTKHKTHSDSGCLMPGLTPVSNPRHSSAVQHPTGERSAVWFLVILSMFCYVKAFLFFFSEPEREKQGTLIMGCRRTF